MVGAIAGDNAGESEMEMKGGSVNGNDVEGEAAVTTDKESFERADRALADRDNRGSTCRFGDGSVTEDAPGYSRQQHG